jgi:alanine dehydrogenase
MRRQGARIVPTAEAVFAEAEMIVKVKEPQAVEYRRLKPHQILSPISISRQIRSRPAA